MSGIQESGPVPGTPDSASVHCRMSDEFADFWLCNCGFEALVFWCFAVGRLFALAQNETVAVLIGF